MHLSLHNLTVTFSAPDGSRLPVLGPISLDIEPGSFVCLLGPSGCGKSTLVRTLAGLQTASSGQVVADGQMLREPSRQIAIMFQDANLMPWRTVIDNIALPLELAQIGRAERERSAHQLIPGLGLAGFEMAYPGELSGGMAQRVALGRVLIQNPALLLLDEPFGALDALTREQIGLDLLRIWRQSGPTVIMVTHDINEAVLLADRILVMSQRPGRIIEDLQVPLDRPRSLEMTYTPDFIQTARRVRAAIDRA